MDKLSLISVKDSLVRRGMSIFSVRDFINFFKVKPETAKSFLSYNTRKGHFDRLKNGVYALKSNPPTKFQIANYLQKPSYISFETALSYYGIMPETVYTVTSATTTGTKEYSVKGQSYSYQKIKRGLFFGHHPVKIRGKIVLIANKEKAILDYIYLKSLKKAPISERLYLKDIDSERLGMFVNYFKKEVRKSDAIINYIKKLDL